MNSKPSQSRIGSPVVKETQSFPNLQLLGLLEVHLSLRNLPSVDRFKLAEQCIKFSLRQGPLPSVRPPRDGGVVSTLIPVKGDAIASWSTLAGLAVSVNIGPDSIELLNSDRQLLCQHPRRRLGAVMAPPGPHNALVYVGHDALSDYRLAVIVAMADRETAKEAARHYNTTERRSPSGGNGHTTSRTSTRSDKSISIVSSPAELNRSSNLSTVSSFSPPDRSAMRHSAHPNLAANHFGDNQLRQVEPALPPRRPVRNSRPSTAGGFSTTTDFEDHDYENDPFYDNFGFNCGEQEKLYDPVVLVVDAPRKKKMSDEILFQHLRRFVDEERNYCELLDDLIQFRNGSSDDKFRYALKHLLTIKTFHAKLLYKLTSGEKPLSIDMVSEAFNSLAGDMRCYVDYLRVTQVVDQVARNHLSNNKKVMSDLIQTRKRIITYHLNFETWLDATASSVEYDKLLNTISTLKEICREADTMMIIAGVRKSPYCLEFYVPLIRHGNFSVEGKGFKKEQSYKLLLFRDLLVFSISADQHIECFEVLRLEQLKLVEDKRSDKEVRLKLRVDHGERRGKEVIQLSSVSDSTTNQWKEDIKGLLENLSMKIAQAYHHTQVE